MRNIEYTQRNWPLGVPPSGGVQVDQQRAYSLQGVTLNQPLLIAPGNSLRTYFAIQNNGGGAISIGIGQPTLQGIILQAGGSYERWYTMTAQPIYAVPLYSPASTDFVSIDEGSMQGGSD
jgi:hypothetical protein